MMEGPVTLLSQVTGVPIPGHCHRAQNKPGLAALCIKMGPSPLFSWAESGIRPGRGSRPPVGGPCPEEGSVDCCPRVPPRHPAPGRPCPPRPSAWTSASLDLEHGERRAFPERGSAAEKLRICRRRNPRKLDGRRGPGWRRQSGWRFQGQRIGPSSHPRRRFRQSPGVGAGATGVREGF